MSIDGYTPDDLAAKLEERCHRYRDLGMENSQAPLRRLSHDSIMQEYVRRGLGGDKDRTFNESLKLIHTLQQQCDGLHRAYTDLLVFSTQFIEKFVATDPQKYGPDAWVESATLAVRHLMVHLEEVQSSEAAAELASLESESSEDGGRMLDDISACQLMCRDTLKVLEKIGQNLERIETAREDD